MIQNDKLQKNLLLKKEHEQINLKPLNVKHKTQRWRSCLGNVSLTPHETEVQLFCFSVYLHTQRVQRYDPHAVPTDSPLSLSGRTCTCCWILLHSGIHFNHMICFCFLSSRCHDNLVYGCPGQQVKHRTPKQKGEFPIPSKQERFASAQEKQHASDIKKKVWRRNNTCSRAQSQADEQPEPHFNPSHLCAHIHQHFVLQWALLPSKFY